MNLLYSLPIQDVKINDCFWNRYTNLIPEVVLPYQWEILNDRVPDALASYCLRNFKIAAGEIEGERHGTVFLDSDVYKWLEAVAYSLATRPNAALEATADEVIALIGRAQCADGYLDTYYTLVEPDGRWTNLTEGHELYCAGHLAEAAVAYYETTGKKQLLDITCRFLDLIRSVFGPGEDQLHGCPGHPEVELALVRLWHATGEKKYLELAKYFVDVRGTEPNCFEQEIARPDFVHTSPEFADWTPEYAQSHLPVREQTTAEGHAVRAVYLYCAMADLAAEYDDRALLKQCEILWDNMVKRRMYVTGSIGSSGYLERFTADFDLPNDTNYSETCASIGLARFGLRMARATRDAKYLDVVERALYNTIRGGISMQGNRYFYVNPLEVWPEVCLPSTSRAHVKPVRQKWFDVACCPTNMARTFTALGQYMYSAGDDELFVNLFVQNQTQVTLGDKKVSISMQTEYPKTGAVRMEIRADAAAFALYVRIPAFAKTPVFMLNGEAIPCDVQNGFCKIERVWTTDIVEFAFSVQPMLVYANPLVRANVGKVAIMRGPEVYCFEEMDNGQDLAALYLDRDVVLEEEWDETLLGGTMVVRCKASKQVSADTEHSFGFENLAKKETVQLKAIPYGSWSNRTPGEMIVWVHLSV